MTYLRTVGRFEPWLVFLAGPPLVLSEWFPPIARVLALAWLAVLLLARVVATGRLTLRTPLDPPLVALALMIPAAAAAASQPSAAASRIWSLLFAVAVYYAIANGVVRPRQGWSAAMWFLVAGMGLSAVGLVSVDWVEKLPGAARVIGGLPSLALNMPHPTLGAGVHPNELAGLLILFVPLAVSLLIWPRPKETHVSGSPLLPPPAMRGLAVFSLVAIAPTLLLTQSRGAWFALAGALACMGLAYAWGDAFAAARTGSVAVSRYGAAQRAARGASIVAAIAIAIAVAFPVGMTIMRGIVGRGPPESVANLFAGRAKVWSDVLAMLEESPLAGIGLNTFPLVYDQRPEYEGRYIYAGIAHAHNTLLQSGVDFGLPGMAAVAAIIAALAWTAWRASWRLGHTPMGPLVVGLAFGLLAHMFHGLVDAVAIGSKPGFVAWAFAGLLAAVRIRGRVWTAEAPALHRVGADTPDGSSDSKVTAPGVDVVAEPVTGGTRMPRIPTVDPQSIPVSPAGYQRLSWTAAILAWSLTSAAAVFLAQADSGLTGVGIACSGGALFGVLSARRLDGRRDKVRHGRSSRRKQLEAYVRAANPIRNRRHHRGSHSRSSGSRKPRQK